MGNLKAVFRCFARNGPILGHWPDSVMCSRKSQPLLIYIALTKRLPEMLHLRRAGGKIVGN
jgi:hypothetical protein